MTTMTKPIGIIHAEGVGPEIMHETLKCLDALQKRLGITFRLIEYDGDAPARSFSETAYQNLKTFYTEIKKQGGCILRSAIYARTVYQLRRDFELAIKPIYFTPFPELVDSCFLFSIQSEKINFLLIRENIGDFLPTHEILTGAEGTRSYEAHFHMKEEYITTIARFAFTEARKRNKQSVFLLMKKDIESIYTKLWLGLFEKVAKEYPGVTWVGAGHPDTVFSNISYTAEKYDVLVTLNREGDLITDSLALLLYGSHAIIPSANISADGFMVFQTVHGTGSGIGKQNKANPIGMIRSAALMLRLFFKLDTAADMIEDAVHSVLKRGFRTVDLYRENSNHTLVGTKEMGELIVAELSSNTKDVL